MPCSRFFPFSFSLSLSLSLSLSFAPFSLSSFQTTAKHHEDTISSLNHSLEEHKSTWDKEKSQLLLQSQGEKESHRKQLESARQEIQSRDGRIGELEMTMQVFLL